MHCCHCGKPLLKKSADGKWRVRTKGVLAFSLSESGVSCETVCPHCNSDTPIALQSAQIETIIKAATAARPAAVARPISFYITPPRGPESER